MKRTVRELYRDCLRSVRHAAGRSAKGRAISATIRRSFDANKSLTAEADIAAAKNDAMNGLSNYLTMIGINQLVNTNKHKSKAEHQDDDHDDDMRDDNDDEAEDDDADDDDDTDRDAADADTLSDDVADESNPAVAARIAELRRRAAEIREGNGDRS